MLKRQLTIFTFYTNHFPLQVRTHTKRESVMQNMHNKIDYPFDYFFEHASAKTTPSPEEQEVGVVKADTLVDNSSSD